MSLFGPVNSGLQCVSVIPPRTTALDSGQARGRGGERWRVRERKRRDITRDRENKKRDDEGKEELKKERNTEREKKRERERNSVTWGEKEK